MLHFEIPLSHDRTLAERNPLSVFRNLPARRLEVRLGKFQLVDFFDLNSAGSDSHLQFLNLTVDNNGAYDYAADTRGYTVGAMFDFEDHNWGIRFAEALMPGKPTLLTWSGTFPALALRISNSNCARVFCRTEAEWSG